MPLMPLALRLPSKVNRSGPPCSSKWLAALVQAEILEGDLARALGRHVEAGQGARRPGAFVQDDGGRLTAYTELADPAGFRNRYRFLGLRQCAQSERAQGGECRCVSHAFGPFFFTKRYFSKY
ncbi:hypothetical protein LP419_29565 [Massilia sp. H-1]|nr:hypothetical protein LP419_29565 [Massilia sp. H-1]